MGRCLGTHGATHPPRKESTKSMGRPSTFTPEMLDELRQEYVDQNPLSTLNDTNAHLHEKFNATQDKTSISRRLKELGYSLSIVSRGVTPTEKLNLPDISPEDMERVMQDPNGKEAMASAKGDVYAWVFSTTPVQRRIGNKGIKGNQYYNKNTTKNPVQEPPDTLGESTDMDLPDPTDASRSPANSNVLGTNQGSVQFVTQD